MPARGPGASNFWPGPASGAAVMNDFSSWVIVLGGLIGGACLALAMAVGGIVWLAGLRPGRRGRR